MTSGIIDVALMFNFVIVPYGGYSAFKEKLDKCRNDELTVKQARFVENLDLLIENDQKGIKSSKAGEMCFSAARMVLMERAYELIK